jgi:hypothetical protein
MRASTWILRKSAQTPLDVPPLHVAMSQLPPALQPLKTT